MEIATQFSLKEFHSDVLEWATDHHIHSTTKKNIFNAPEW